MRRKFFEKRARGRDGDRTLRLALFALSLVRSFRLARFTLDSVVLVVRGSWFDGDARAGARGVGGVRRSPHRRSRERGRGVVLEPKNGNVDDFRARASALGLDTCIDTGDASPRGRSAGACDESILAFSCESLRRRGSDGFACGARDAPNTPIDARTFDSCIAPMCATEVCAQGGRGIARAFCAEACDSRARFGSRFGESWSTSALNPVNFNAMLGALTTSYPGAASLVQSFVRVQTTIFLMRTIYNAVMSSLGEASSSSAAPSFSTSPSFSASPSPSPSTIYFPTPSPSPSPSPASPPTTACGGVGDTCSESCGLCIYPDSTSDNPTCCCDATCFDYGDCCGDVGGCCPSLGKSNANVRARSRAAVRSRASG